jgi:hypothetical protein
MMYACILCVFDACRQNLHFCPIYSILIFTHLLVARSKPFTFTCVQNDRTKKKKSCTHALWISPDNEVIAGVDHLGFTCIMGRVTCIMKGIPAVKLAVPIGTGPCLAITLPIRANLHGALIA